jgi:ATP-dependent exoDNAse (exonuclease V) beta subunit
VLLPELDVSMTNQGAKMLRSRPDPERELAGVSIAPSAAVCALDPEGLAKLRHEEEARYVQEALCLLYVAMTRAAHRLDLIVRPKGTRTTTLSWATVLRDALGRQPSAETGDEPIAGARLLWRHPDSSAVWWAEPDDRTAGEAAREARIPVFAQPAAPRDLPRKSPSAEEGGHAVDVRDVLRARRAGGFARGTLIHRWLEEVGWLEDFDVADAALDEVGLAIEPDAARRAEALRAFRAALGRSGLRALLARPEGDVELWRERAFSEVVVEDGAEVLWSGAFDRVVLVREGGRIARAEVIDFKTDRVAAGEIDERAEFYAPQLASYRRVLARMTGLPAGAVVGTLAFVEADVVRRA